MHTKNQVRFDVSWLFQREHWTQASGANGQCSCHQAIVHIDKSSKDSILQFNVWQKGLFYTMMWIHVFLHSYLWFEICNSQPYKCICVWYVIGHVGHLGIHNKK